MKDESDCDKKIVLVGVHAIREGCRGVIDFEPDGKRTRKSLIEAAASATDKG